MLAIPSIDDEHRDLTARALQDEQGSAGEATTVWCVGDEEMMSADLPYR